MSEKISAKESADIVKRIINEHFGVNTPAPYHAKNEDEVTAIVFDYVKRNQESKNSLLSRISSGLSPMPKDDGIPDAAYVMSEE